MSKCPIAHYNVPLVELKRSAMQRHSKDAESTTSQINACQLGAFPRIAEEDEDEAPHMDTDETDEEAQDASPALDHDLDSDVVDVDNLNTTQTLECSKGEYNVKIRK
jgi:hypothetical protein